MLQLCHDYTLADVDRLTRVAVFSVGRLASDARDRYDAAWYAITEHLYTVEAPPGPGDLIWVGRTAIYDEIRDYRHHHGFFKSDYHNGPGSSPAFWRYWWPVTWAVPSRENVIVERMALWQILDVMHPVRREAIIALATFDTYDRAAMALGISYRAFVIRLNHARADFRALWHEGEAPSRMWGSDQRKLRYANDT